MKKLALVLVVAAVVVGCKSLSEKAFKTDAYGAFGNSSGTMGIGKINVMTIPQEQSFIRAEYEEDTSLFSPSTVLKSWNFTWSGGVCTNADSRAAVEVIKALGKLASPTNAVEVR